MSHVDALSRCHAILILEGNTFERILSVKQDKDEVMQQLRTQLENAESKYFELRDGLVYRKNKNNKLLFYVPECLENNIIRTCHDDIGHVGIGKVIENIMRVYWFPGLHTKVKRYIENCLKCIEFSPNSGKVQGYLHQIPKECLPFQTIHIDHLGPLEKSGKGFKHILLIVDGFTKFVRLYPCKSTTTEEALKHLNGYFRSYSNPKRIVSDRGSFTSNKFITALKELDIQHVLVAVATPRANGQAERINRLLIPIITKTTISNNTWNETLQSAEYAINNTVNRSTNSTPSKLLFGINQNNKSCDRIREMLETLSAEERDFPTIRQQASDAIKVLQDENSEAYNRKRKPPNQYAEGDYVMIRNIDNTPGINKKLIPKYKGPYVIKTVLDHDRYIVSDIDGFQISQIPYTGTISVDQMRRYENM